MVQHSHFKITSWWLNVINWLEFFVAFHTCHSGKYFDAFLSNAPDDIYNTNL